MTSTADAISLFSGVGMFDLAVSLAGFNIVAQVEINEYCRKVLKRHAPSYWPNAARFADVHEFGRSSITGDIALVFGGFPCQPHSVAGSRKGEDDSRNLWPEFKRIIGELRPRAVLLENVPGITQAYTVEDKLRPAYALTVIADLAELGYDAGWGIISAADAGAPHNRARWWCVAYANRERRQRPPARKPAHHIHRKHTPHQRGWGAVLYAPQPGGQDVAHTNGKWQSQSSGFIRKERGWTGNRRQTLGNTQCAGLQKREGVRRRVQQKLAPAQRTGGQDVAHTNCQRSEKQGKQHRSTKAENRRRTQYRLGLPGPRPPQPRMGGAAHGITPRLDGLRWPARPDVPQHEWEAPRTIPPRTIENRVERIKALGNGGIWAVAYALACEIRERLNT